MASPAAKTRKPKRFVVTVGDVVRFHSPTAHASGRVGTVTHVLDAKRVIVASHSSEYEWYDGMEWIVLTREPTGQTPDGEEKSEYRFWIKGVLHRQPAAPTPPTPRKKAKRRKVITSKQELIEHIQSGDPVKVAFVDPGESA